MKKAFFMPLLVAGIALFSCQEELPIESQSQQDLSYENDLSGIELRSATNGIKTYWGYSSERYLANKINHYFDSSIESVNNKYKAGFYIVDHIEVTKKIPVPTGYTAFVEDTPNAGYLPTDESKRGINGKMVKNELVLTTRVYAVRTTASGTPVNIYMPKIHTYSNDLQQLPWNVREFKLIAHRGFHRNSGEKENTVGAFIKAQEKGVYGSEIDVWVTADGYPVVYHNDLYNEVPIVEINYKGNLEYKIPSLESFLIQAKNSNVTKLVLDIKPRPTGYANEAKDVIDADKIMDVIKDSKIGFSSIDYLSFSQAICQKIVQRAGSTASVYLLVDETHNHNPRYNITNLKRMGVNGISFGYAYLCWNGYRYGDLNTDNIKEAKSADMKVNVWTVDNINIMRKLLDAGVDNISTDELAQFWAN